MSQYGKTGRKRSGYKVVIGKSESIREDDVSSPSSILTKCPNCLAEFELTLDE